jgi:hypothetical protein
MIQVENKSSVENVYLGEVLAEQARVERELQRQAPAAPPGAAGWGPPGSVDYDTGGPAAAAAPQARAIGYRITGWWRWKTVVVPPNVYVVHTRRGHAGPVTQGLGLSFRFDPYTDAFLLIPASLQTIVINAKCIATERQGILVQAYVQWMVDDLTTAYHRLDFSDAADPMRIVNVQLREQAEAVIKDKVATMSIDQVLTDKQPIIEELTLRLRALADGLGLKIVTVQIKEAVVSSTRLWENLQKPFRAEREKLARLAELAAQQEVTARELEAREAQQAAELEAQRLMAERRAAVEREQYDRDQAEKGRRHRLEQEAEQRAIGERNQTEMARKAAELELALKELELQARRIEQEIESVRRQMQLDQVQHEQAQTQTLAELGLEEERSKAAAVRSERDVVLFRARRAVENDVSEGLARSQLIEQLPEIAGSLPKPEELRAVTISGDSNGLGSLVGFLASALGLAEDALRHRAAANGTQPQGPANAP